MLIYLFIKLNNLLLKKNLQHETQQLQKTFVNKKNLEQKYKIIY